MRIAIALALLATMAATLLADEDAKTEKSVESGRKWLIKAQNADGSWGMDHRTRADISATALCGLALLAGGDTPREATNAETANALRKAVGYLMTRARRAPAGRDIAQGESSEFQTYVGQYIHSYFTVIFFSQVHGMRPAIVDAATADEMKEHIGKLTTFLASAQDSDGSWHRNTYSSLQATAFAWTALRAASSTGTQIKHASVDRTLQFVLRQYNPNSKLFLQVNGKPIYDSASAIRVLYGSPYRNDSRTQNAVDSILRELTEGHSRHHFLTATGEDYPAAFMLSHALSTEPGPRWERWQKFVTERLFRLQNRDGSWTATSCLTGRTVPTACAMLCLQTPLRLLPMQEL